MYFKNYEYFLMIAEEGSISKAADKLYLTQPSLSKYLKRLEENLGVELFSRDRYPLALTQAGIIYKRYVEEIRAKERQLQQEFSEFREGLFGHVTLALTEWRSSVMLPALVSLLSRAVSSYHPVRKGRFSSADALLAGTRTGRSGPDALSQ